MTIINRLKGSKAPNLPIGPVEYSQRFQDQFNNVLRLYFNEIDNITGALLGDNPGNYFNLPFVAASDSTDQYAGGNNTPTVVKWNTLEASYGWILNPTNSATAEYDGTYKITYSLEFANTANAAHYVTVWLKVNNVDVPNSGTKFFIPARKSATPGQEGFVCAYSEIVFIMDAGDDVELWWATDLAYNPVGPVDGVYMLHEPVQTTPYAHPAIPSAVGSITFVSRKPT